MNQELLNQRLVETWGHFPTLREFQIGVIETAMKKAGGNQCAAASMLGLERQALDNLFKSLNMSQMITKKQGTPDQLCNYLDCQKIFLDAKIFANAKIFADISTCSIN